MFRQGDCVELIDLPGHTPLESHIGKTFVIIKTWGGQGREPYAICPGSGVDGYWWAWGKHLRLVENIDETTKELINAL